MESTATTIRRIHIRSTVLAIAAACVAFVLLAPVLGAPGAAALTACLAAAAAMWGVRAGALAGLGALLLVIVQFPGESASGEPSTGLQGIAAAAALLLAGIVPGHLFERHRLLEQEIEERERSASELRDSEQAYRALAESSKDFFYRLDRDGTFTLVSPAFERMTGWPPEEMYGTSFTALLHPEDVPAARKQIDEIVLDNRTPKPADLRIRSRSGLVLTCEFAAVPFLRDGRLEGVFGSARDVTERTWAAEQLLHLAYYDSLTGLPNRELFLDRLRQSLVQTLRAQGMLAVILLDLDRFKAVNNALGHRTGDLLLMAVAHRLSRALRESDTVARHGGDEFIIAVPGIRSASDAVLVAKKVAGVMAAPFAVNGQDLFVTASLGVSLAPADGSDADTLIRHADVAMYQAKSQGRNSFHFYAHTMHAEALRKLVLENHLQRAVERGEMLLHYQPLVDVATGAVVGAEALVRWQHPVMGLLYPLEFIPLAEETGLIVPLGEWLLQQACKQARSWQASGWPALRMSLNLSMRQFLQNDLPAQVRKALERSGLDPGFLDLELTESMLMPDGERTMTTLRDLKALGVHLTIDDFGTGYSSLSCLKDLPLSTLKLDRSFVNSISADRGNQAVSKAIVALAHNLNMRVIGEGVETADQLEYLRSLRCDEVQGYLFSRPVSANDMTQFMVDTAV